MLLVSWLLSLLLFMSNSLHMDSLYVDSLYMDSVYMDSVFVDSVYVDSLHGLCVCGLFAHGLCVHGLQHSRHSCSSPSCFSRNKKLSCFLATIREIDFTIQIYLCFYRSLIRNRNMSMANTLSQTLFSPLYNFLFFLINYFYRSIVDLQCCISFFCILSGSYFIIYIYMSYTHLYPLFSRFCSYIGHYNTE